MSKKETEVEQTSEPVQSAQNDQTEQTEQTEQTQQPAEKEVNFFEQRMSALGINPNSKEWCIELINPDAEFPQPETAQWPIFSEDEKGNIRILVYSIEGELINYTKFTDAKTASLNAKIKQFYVTRLKTPRVDKNGRTVKYQMPKGEGTFPFFPPALLKKFAAKEKIKTLILTEGYFKAAKGSMHGLDIVGLSSITHWIDKKTNQLHGDIKRLMTFCSVENVIWLTDGDCRNITTAEISDAKDLYERPRRFYNSVNQFRDLFSDYDCKKYFAHVQSDSLPAKPKGLDDLLIELPGEEQAAVDDLLSMSKKGGHYFHKIDVTEGIRKVHTYFYLHDVLQFYLFHVEKRPELEHKQFVFNGTMYRYNKQDNKVDIVVPADAKRYFRVGDQYHEFIKIPNKYNQLDLTFHRRQKSTIVDDHSKRIIEHIPKYHAFCNTPDHLNYQQVIHNCFNVYAPFEHEPEEGEFPHTEAFLKHIFGTADIHYTDKATDTKETVNEYQLGLDYLTLLLMKPTQVLPILCLVSPENQTGKSTFASWLRLMFTQNVAIVGNAELANDFNASWATKLIIICDEAKIDKQVVIEKVKSLSTAPKVFMNAKGKDHVEIDFFGKFIFLTNNDENFIYATEEDIRYWIRKVHRIPKLNVDLMSNLQEEIPAFVHFLTTRKMATPSRERHWFSSDLIKTDALKKVIAHSASTLEKELIYNLRSTFLDFGCDEILMSISDLQEEWFKKRFEGGYIQKTVTGKLKCDSYHKWEYGGKIYKTKDEILAYLGQETFTDEQAAAIKRENMVRRYSYPKWGYVTTAEGKHVMQRINVQKIGRPYVFRRADFLSPEEMDSIKMDAELQDENNLDSPPTYPEPTQADGADDLPF